MHVELINDAEPGGLRISRDGVGNSPTTPLFLTFRFSALTMREIRLVMTPLDPGHEGQALLNRIGMQGQHDFEEPAEL